MAERLMLKIAICTPVHGDTRWRFTNSLARMIATTSRARVNFGGETLTPEIEMMMISTSMLVWSRQQLLEAAVKWGAGYILWADADHIFPPDALLRLLAHGLLVVGANYSSRSSGPTKPTATRIVDGEREPVWTTEELAKAGTVEEVDGLGLGFCLINIRALNQLRAYMDKAGLSPNVLFEQKLLMSEANVMTLAGEDTHFFGLLRAAGVPIHVDHSLSWEIGHVSERILTNFDTIEDRDVWKARNPLG